MKSSFINQSSCASVLFPCYCWKACCRNSMNFLFIFFYKFDVCILTAPFLPFILWAMLYHRCYGSQDLGALSPPGVTTHSLSLQHYTLDNSPPSHGGLSISSLLLLQSKSIFKQEQLESYRFHSISDPFTSPFHHWINTFLFQWEMACNTPPKTADVFIVGRAHL